MAGIFNSAIFNDGIFNADVVAAQEVSGGTKHFLPYIAYPIPQDTSWDIIGLGGIQSRAYVSPVTITIYPRDKSKRREEELLLLVA